MSCGCFLRKTPSKNIKHYPELEYIPVPYSYTTKREAVAKLKRKIKDKHEEVPINWANN